MISKEAHKLIWMRSSILVCGLMMLGCNPTGPITVTGPTGEMTVVLKEDDADLGTARALAKEAIEEFVEERNRFPKLEELRQLKVTWHGENHLAGITDIVSVEVEEKE